MKILHVIDTLGMGGAEQMLVTLLPALKAAGDEVGVCVLREPLTLQPAIEAKGINVVRLPAFNKWNLRGGAKAVAKAAQNGGYDIIHAHLLFPGVYTGLAKIMRLTQAKTCITYHNQAYAPGCNKPGLGLWLRKRLNAISSKNGMNGRLAVSQACADHYAKHLKPGPIEVLLNPVDIAAIDQAISGVTPDKDDVLNLLLPGRLVPEKGHDVLIDALAMLAQEGLNFRAVFAGHGPLEAHIHSRIDAAGLGDEIKMAGYLAHADMLKAMRRADIVIVPSLFEGFGLTAVEAMLAARPVIAARTGGLPEIISHEETGLLVPSGDATALAAAIRRLADNTSLRAAYGAAGRKLSETRYGLPAITERLRRFYNGLMTNS